MLAVVQLGTCPVPDAGGDVIIAQVTFQCVANGTGNISVKGIDSFDTTVGCTSGIVYDATMGTNALSVTIAAAGCTGNAQCDDGIYCNGAETCNIGTGQPGTAIVCNDGIACTTDSCNEATDNCDYIPKNCRLCCTVWVEVCPASGCLYPAQQSTCVACLQRHGIMR